MVKLPRRRFPLDIRHIREQLIFPFLLTAIGGIASYDFHRVKVAVVDETIEGKGLISRKTGPHSDIFHKAIADHVGMSWSAGNQPGLALRAMLDAPSANQRGSD